MNLIFPFFFFFRRVIETNPDAKRIYDALLDPIRRKQLVGIILFLSSFRVEMKESFFLLQVAHLARNHSPGLVLFLSAVLQYERIEYVKMKYFLFFVSILNSIFFLG